MLRNRLSLRVGVGLSILAMGILLGMLLTFLSGEVYRSLTLDTQRATLVDFMRAETNKLREDFETHVHGLARYGQDELATAEALNTGKTSLLVRQLDNLYRLAEIAPGSVRPNRLFRFDAALKLLASSSLGADRLAAPPCPESLARMASAPERRGATNRLCLVGEQAYLVALTRARSQKGDYLYAAAELVPGLMAMEHELGTLRLRRNDGAVIYQSSDWARLEQVALRVVATYPLRLASPKSPPLELELAKDLTGFQDRLTDLRYLVLLCVAIVTVFAMLIALWGLERTALKPLRALTVQLQRVRHDKRNLGEQVVVRGNREITELAEGFNDMTARLRELYESLERMAFTDALTTLPNRSLFQDRLQQSILNAKREAKPFALLIMDLDRFKDINDTLGHHIGDLLLTQVAQRLRGKLRASDTVARMGGDEFAVLLPAVDAKHAGTAARMLLQALRAPLPVEAHRLHIGASIGIALYPEHGVDANVLMQRADVAMYEAKGNGNGFAFYNHKLDQHYPTRLTLLSELRQAVEQEQFELYYQPIVNLTNDRVSSIEALVRWRHPRDGVIQPEGFVPMLEQSGLMRSLMPWMMSAALKRAHDLQIAGMPLTVSINLSMRDLQDPYIVESFAEQLDANQVAAGSIVIEITESAVMNDPPRTLELLGRLSGMGLKIAIDDFGTGYSSLAYLKKLPVDTLKIDKSFVMAMTSEENDAAIVRASIDLAHNLGLKVIAEGVENELVLSQLRDLGCDLVQGHYVGRPLNETELTEWLAQSTWGFGDAARRKVAAIKRILT